MAEKNTPDPPKLANEDRQDIARQVADEIHLLQSVEKDVRHAMEICAGADTRERTPPMTLAELARRFSGKPDARGDKWKPTLERHGLKRVRGRARLYTIALDGLDKATRRRMLGQK
jgi:hypothetical protein